MSTDPRQRLVALLPELAAALADLLASDDQAKAPRYFSAEEPGPYKTARAFLDAGRRGDFPTLRVGRRVVALATDVHAAIERSAPRRARRVKSADPLLARSMKAA